MRNTEQIGRSFVDSIINMWRISKYTRILINNKKLDPEEQVRYRKKAQAALGAAGSFLALSVLSIILAIFFR